MPKESQTEMLLTTILVELANIKKGLFNEDVIELSEVVKELKQEVSELRYLSESVTSLKSDLSELKYTLLNPEDGVIVKVNKNTDFRLSREPKIPHYEDKVRQLDDIIKWKDGVNRALWIIFTTLVGIAIKIVFFGSNGVID